jgi:hypothetical protein
VTYAEPGGSFHNYGLAFDVCFSGEDPYLDQVPAGIRSFLWNELGCTGEIFGLKWGGRFRNPDMPHFQLAPKGVTTSQLYILYEHNGLEAVFKKLDQLLDPHYAVG